MKKVNREGNAMGKTSTTELILNSKEFKIPGNMLKRLLKIGQDTTAGMTIAKPGTQEYKRIMKDPTVSKEQKELLEQRFEETEK